MSDNLFDPFGFFGPQREAVQRITAQQREAIRQGRLTAARSDVDAAYLAFRNHSDATSAQNLLDAVKGYLSVADPDP